MEALALDRAVLDCDKAAATEAPVEQSPVADQDQMAAWAKDLRDGAWAEATAGLGQQVEEVVGEGEVAQAPMLERNPSLRIQADPGYRRVDRVSRGIDAAHARRRELTREEERAVTLATADLQDALRALPQMEDSRREGG
jgi:hypothetical protein